MRMIPDVARFLANQNVLLSGELTRNGLKHNENRCWYGTCYGVVGLSLSRERGVQK